MNIDSAGGTYFDTRSHNSGGTGYNGISPYFVTVNGAIKLRIWDGVGNTLRYTSALDFSTSTWYHVAVKRASTTYTVYINGIANGSTWSNSNDYSGRQIHLGSNHHNAGRVDGKIGSFAMHDRALSDAEILADYNGNKDTYGL